MMEQGQVRVADADALQSDEQEALREQSSDSSTEEVPEGQDSTAATADATAGSELQQEEHHAENNEKKHAPEQKRQEQPDKTGILLGPGAFEVSPFVESVGGRIVKQRRPFDSSSMMSSSGAHLLEEEQCSLSSVGSVGSNNDNNAAVVSDYRNHTASSMTAVDADVEMASMSSLTTAAVLSESTSFFYNNVGNAQVLEAELIDEESLATAIQLSQARTVLNATSVNIVDPPPFREHHPDTVMYNNNAYIRLKTGTKIVFVLIVSLLIVIIAFCVIIGIGMNRNKLRRRS